MGFPYAPASKIGNYFLQKNSGTKTTHIQKLYSQEEKGLRHVP
jgi:hypothetical protein